MRIRLPIQVTRHGQKEGGLYLCGCSAVLILTPTTVFIPYKQDAKEQS